MVPRERPAPVPDKDSSVGAMALVYGTVSRGASLRMTVAFPEADSKSRTGALQPDA